MSHQQSSAAERFWAKVQKTPECWLWTAALHRDGYGKFKDDGRTVYAHRWAYEALVGPIPDGLTLDHVQARGCTSRACVNPAHLEPVTRGENTLRGDGPSAENLRRTHCPAGHPYTEANTYRPPTGGRQCVTCRAEEAREKVSCEVCGGPPMFKTNLYAHRRTVKHQARLALC